MNSELRSTLKSPHLSETVSKLGVRGIAKSLYHSHRYGNAFDDFLIHPNVVTEVSPHASVSVDGQFHIGVSSGGVTHRDLGQSKFTLGSDSSFDINAPDGRASVGPCSTLSVHGEFSMGDSYINGHTDVMCYDSITIGDGCAIAWGVTILDDDRHTLVLGGEEQPQTSPIVVGDNVWIGHGVTIKKGVEIGDGAVIGSDSVVTSDIPPKSLAVGSPAKVVQEDVSWNR